MIPPDYVKYHYAETSILKDRHIVHTIAVQGHVLLLIAKELHKERPLFVLDTEEGRDASFLIAVSLIFSKNLLRIHM